MVDNKLDVDKTPLVSIITPFYNTPLPFFQEAVQSVFAQTYKNWELILVDDGSTEPITQHAIDYASQNPGKVYYYEHKNHENLGHSAARNLGIRYSKGKYIAFLDSDDVWMEHKLMKQVPILENNPEVGMVYGNTRYWFSWTDNPGDLERDFIPKLGVKPETIVHPPDLLSLFLNGKAAVPCMNTLLVRRDVVNKYGGFEEKFRSLYEDQILYAKVILSEDVFVSGEIFDWYRKHEKSITSKASLKEEIVVRQAYLHWLEEYLDQKSITDERIWREIKRELWRVNSPEWFPENKHLRKTLRWVKKWILKTEARILPAYLSNKIFQIN